jgi:N-methylhydantoinase A/oxoprolinase/acetone carboxylase beta subunit
VCSNCSSFFFSRSNLAFLLSPCFKNYAQLVTHAHCTYRKGGPLAVTDANLILGRLIPDYFPKIFGKGENEGLDAEASQTGFEKLAKEINDYYGSHTGSGESATAAGGGGGGGGGEKSLDEIVYGFIKVANETMCRPIRALTEARGFEMGKHMCVFDFKHSVFYSFSFFFVLSII